MPATAHAPSQVMLQAPPVQVICEPAPTVCVHDAPEQLTLQFGPHVPVQVAPLAQAKLQPDVVPLQASKPQL